MELNWNFLGGWGVQNKKNLYGRSMDIFWKCTMSINCSRGTVTAIPVFRSILFKDLTKNLFCNMKLLLQHREENNQV